MTRASEVAERWEFVDGGRLLPEAVVSAIGYRSELAAPVLHRGVPSPAVTVVFSLDEPVVSAFSPERALAPDAHSTEIVLGGLHTRPAFIVQPRVQTGLQLAVRPLAARVLFGMPIGELHDQTVHAVDVLGPEAERLRERMAELPTWDERFAALTGYLCDLMADDAGREPRADVVEAWRWIAWHKGNGSMTELARHVHLSERQLATVFKAELGLTPKAVSRLMRFEYARQRIVHAVRHGKPVDIAATAHGCGYYDHSHLVRDFQQYLGTSPSRWLDEERGNIQAGAAQRNEEFQA